MIADLYIRRARCWRIIDSDTIDVTVDGGFGVYLDQRLRLLDVWAPEIRGPERPEGLVSQAAAESWFVERGGWAAPGVRDRWGRITPVVAEPWGWPLVIRTEPDPDSFRRYLAVVWSAIVEGPSLNDWLVAGGFATATKGAA